jgi:hypothetical protein
MIPTRTAGHAPRAEKPVIDHNFLIPARSARATDQVVAHGGIDGGQLAISGGKGKAGR